MVGRWVVAYSCAIKIMKKFAVAAFVVGSFVWLCVFTCMAKRVQPANGDASIHRTTTSAEEKMMTNPVMEVAKSNPHGALAASDHE